MNDFISEVDSSQQILVSDTGNDQTLLTSVWRVIRRTGREVMMTGAFAGRNVGEVFPVVSAVAKLVCENGKAYAAYAHEALLDMNPAQKESLLSVHQSLRDQRNGIDDRARCERDVGGNPGLQMARFGEHKLPFYFDGSKCFFEVYPITDAEERTLPRVTLTDGSVPYEPIARLHSRRRLVSAVDTVAWKRCLGFSPDHVVDKTLLATTQMVPTVEAETREMMRDHFQTRLPQLKVRRVNDVCYVDTFFSSIPSVRGFTCWNLYCFQRTGLDVVFLMRRRSQSPTTLPQMVTTCGAPLVLKSDNAPEFRGKRWVDYLDTMSIRSEFTEAHHPNENLAERRGGALKAATVHLMKITGCPLTYWCFALEYMCLLRTVLARRSLNWTTPHEKHWGDRPDISVFRFIFWEPIWYYQPRQPFPKPKMLKGRFLGIAQNIGDAFCFLILTQPDSDDSTSPQVLARSVIRRRFPREHSAPDLDVEHEEPSSISFYRSDQRTPLADPVDVPDNDAAPTDSPGDVVAGSVMELRALLPSASESGVSQFPDDFDDGIFEVYGPPTKRPRHSNVDLEVSSPVVLDGATQQPTSTVSEEVSVFVDSESSSASLGPPVRLSDSSPAFSCDSGSANVNLAAFAHADPMNDGLSGDHHDDDPDFQQGSYCLPGHAGR